MWLLPYGDRGREAGLVFRDIRAVFDRFFFNSLLYMCVCVCGNVVSLLLKQVFA